MTDPGRAALIRYLADCIRAEQRAHELWRLRRARVRDAVRQITEWDRSTVVTAEQMQATIRAAKRARNVRKRAS